MMLLTSSTTNAVCKKINFYISSVQHWLAFNGRLVITRSLVFEFVNVEIR